MPETTRMVMAFSNGNGMKLCPQPGKGRLAGSALTPSPGRPAARRKAGRLTQEGGRAVHRRAAYHNRRRLKALLGEVDRFGGPLALELRDQVLVDRADRPGDGEEG